MFELRDKIAQNAIIKVIGIGGGGSNAVEDMLSASIDKVEFICANTDAQALNKSKIQTRLQLGEKITKGLGAGANPSIGKQAAEEDREKIKEILKDTDMLFITAGMGGGTGTGAAPVFAQIAHELKILTVAIIMEPFDFEGRRRMGIAKEGISELAKYVDSLIIVPNSKLATVLGKDISLLNAFKAANNILLGAVQGIAELITKPGLINVDFADVKTVMREKGMAMMGTGMDSSDDRAKIAAEAAIASPLLKNINFAGAKGILVNITAGPDMSIGEFETVGEIVRSFSSKSAIIVIGTVIDSKMTKEMRVTIVVTGVKQDEKEEMNDVVLERDKNYNYQSLETPTVLRRNEKDFSLEDQSEKDKENLKYLDIPTYLRFKDRVESEDKD